MDNNVRNTDLIVIIDREGKILYYNNFNDRINKFNNSETIGKNIWDVYSWVNKDTPLFKVMEAGQPILNQIMNITIDGNKLVTAINSAYPLKNSEGIIGAIGFSVSSEQISKNKVSRKKTTDYLAKYVFDDIITVNKEMIDMKNKLIKASKSNSNVFIFGESGTGKELFAHSIHNASPRSEKPFVAQNCGAIPSTLMESTFFGTSKGSFTGSEDKKGIFDIADGGTLFLDEINSMPLNLQVKLLRVIEDKSFRRVGDTKDIYCDVRIITASNACMESLLDKYIRRDLFYRLSVINIQIPPLKERKDDIKILCDYYISIFNDMFNKNVKGITNKAMVIFLKYDWPGNVRELRNVLESCFNILEGDILDIEHIPKILIENINLEKKTNSTNLVDKVNEYEKSIITRALLANKYNIASTARYLGIPRQTLYYKLNKYNLQ
ncbi:sigma-54 interaction domain-containing protein [Tissierella praeacuta]|uniref:sigma-54 interaction domain-containing protein n=1 Tax=Tissierella praeacuta TaxID=43131 RepID=UPI003DA477C8